MPYASYRERPGAGGAGFLADEEVRDFLGACSFITTPSRSEANRMAGKFGPAPRCEHELPEEVVGIDGSLAVVPVDDRLPTSKLAFVTVAAVSLDTRAYLEAAEAPGPVDPRATNACFSTRTFHFMLPGRNMHYKGAEGVRGGFRKALHEGFHADRTRLSDKGGTLAHTLHVLLKSLPKQDGGGKVRIQSCPACGQANRPIEIEPDPGRSACPNCQADVYDTDVLALDDTGGEDFDVETAAKRVMNTVEKLIPAHRIISDFRAGTDPYRTGFLLDGPLALFQKPKELTLALGRFHVKAREDARRRGSPPPVTASLVKTGEIPEHMRALRPHLRDGSYMLVSDSYLYEDIRRLPPDPRRKAFGRDNYYGQNFMYAPKGGRFCFALPFPCETREPDPRGRFSMLKHDPDSYPELARAMETIRRLSDARGADAVTVMSKAHEAASISQRDTDRIALRAARALRQKGERT